MGEIDFQINWDDFLKSDAATGNGGYYYSKATNYLDCELILCFVRYTRDSNYNLNVGVKVTKLPPNVLQVTFSQQITVYNGTRRAIIRDDRDSHGSYHYDAGNREGINGIAPYGMGYRCSQARWDDFNNKNRYLRNDGTVHFKLKIFDYKIEMDLAGLMTSIAESLNTQKLPTDTSTLRNKISVLEEENERLNRANEKLEKEFETKESELVNQKSQIVKLRDANKELEVENESLKNQMEVMKKKNEELEKDVSNCQFVDALKNFQPENVKWDDNDAQTLKEIMGRILQVEGIIQEKITFQESCQRCRKKSIQCAMTPCGHLAYCVECYKSIEEEQKNENSVKCPICTTPVSNVINVQ